MKKTKYVSPTMKVVKLQHTRMLMVSGQTQATMETVWEETDL